MPCLGTTEYSFTEETGDLRMAEKAKKQVVSTQYFSPFHYFGDQHPKSLVVWPISTASYFRQEVEAYDSTLEEHVLCG